MPVAAMDRTSGMRRAGRPAWTRAAGMAEAARRKPESTRHSGASRNPVIYIIHSRTAGMTTRKFSDCLSAVILAGLQSFTSNKEALI